jgi:hypothetical protein
MNISVSSRAIGLAVFASIAAGTASAQTSLDVGLTIGLYAPMGSYNGDALCTCLPNSPEDLRGRSVGGQVRLWLSPKLGLQLAAGASNPFTFGGGSSPGGVTPIVTARVRSASLQALLGLTGDGDRARAWIGLGAGIIQHYGDAYQPFGSPTSVGGAATLGGSVRLAGGLNLDAGVSSLIYGMPIAFGGTTLSRGTQVDFSLTTGLSWHFE